MKEINGEYKKHVLVCVNEREHGDCCANVKGNEIHRKIKDYIINNGLSGSVWVNRARCLGFCNNIGTTIIIRDKEFKNERWFTEVTEEDLKEILKFISPAWK